MKDRIIKLLKRYESEMVTANKDQILFKESMDNDRKGNYLYYRDRKIETEHKISNMSLVINDIKELLKETDGKQQNS